MNFQTYNTTGHGRYAKLAEAVANILAAAIRLQPSLKLQHIQRRAKDPSSLRRKLEKAGQLESEDIGAVAKDLAGCRLVFYTNSDVARFQSSGIMTDNFVVDWARTKIHHPSPHTTDAVDLFISNNYVVRLRDERVALPEYAEFRGMWCEVQVQTTLNHAWSEMAHDTVYKIPTLEGFGSALMEGIEKRMNRIMRDYLLPAGYEFQKVVTDFERLSQGKELFDRGALAQLANCTDNNERYDLLQRFREYVLPSYDDLESVHAEVRSAVVVAVEQAYSTEPRAIDTPFGNLPGNTVTQVVTAAADILDYLRYFDVEATFDAICKLFKLAKSEEERKRLLHSTEILSKHELEIWKHAGPLVQQRLVERIRRMGRDEVEPVRPVVMKALGEVLETELSGTSGTYNTVTLHRGAAVPSDALANMRSAAIALVKGFFRDVRADRDRRSIIQALAGAMAIPGVGRASIGLLKTILRDTIEIVEFYIESAPMLSYELLQNLENRLLWEYRRKGKVAKEADPEIAALRTSLVERIFAFRDQINRDEKFVIYKTLVGFESVFPPAWKGEDGHYKAEEAYRNERIAELVSAVTEETAEEWFSIILRCAQTESDDLATFPPFGRFLEALGKSKPGIVLPYLNRLDDRLARFLPSLLDGLVAGGASAAVQEKLRQWIAERRYLGHIIRHERFTVTPDADLLERALSIAIQEGDDLAVLKAVDAAVARHGDVAGGLLNRIFLPALEYLTGKGDTRWVNAASPRATQNSLFKELADPQADKILSSLVPHPEVTYRVEEILQEVANTWPAKVVDFFGERLEFRPKTDEASRYEAIPFQFHLLQKTLQTTPDYLVGTARRWFSNDKRLFRYRGGRFLSNVFTTFTPEFEESLLSVCESGRREDLEFLLQVLNGYNGQAFTHNLSKAIIEKLPANDPMWNGISIALDSTGIVRGEFGLVEAYRQKKAELEQWLSDPRDRVREFARRHIHSLEQQIAAEQRRSEEELELRKRSYESDDHQADPDSPDGPAKPGSS